MNSRASWRVWFVVPLVVLVGCSGGGSPKAVPSSTSIAEEAGPTSTRDAVPASDGPPILTDVVAESWAPATRTDELALEVGTKELTAQQAVDAFALLYPQMPGATPSDLPPGDGLDGSYTWMLIRSVVDRLAADQAAVVEELDAGELIGTINADGETNAAPLAGVPLVPTGDSTTTDDTGPELASFRRINQAKPTATYAHYLQLARTVMRDWQAHRSDLPPFSIELVLSPKSIKGGGMDASPAPGRPTVCRTARRPRLRRPRSERPVDQVLLRP